MNKRTRGFILVTLAIALGAWLFGQSPTFPGIQGFYPTGKKWVGVQVDANGVVQTNSTGGSGCPGTTKTPCVVGGSAAAGAAVAGNPVPAGVSDGTDVRYLLGDTSGRAIVTPQAAPGAAAGNPFPGGSRDDSGNALALHSCPDQADIPTTTGTSLTIIAGVSAKTIYICSISLSLSAAETLTIEQGTMTTNPCDTTTVVIAGGYPNTATIALDFSAYGPMQTTAAAKDVCILLGSSATFGGFVKYAQY